MEGANEILWEGGTPVEDIMCVTVPDGGDKKLLMDALKADGITEINGVSLDEFIVVGTPTYDKIHPSLRPGTEWM